MRVHKMSFLDSIILFDENIPGPTTFDIVIYTAGILIASNLIFIFLCSIVGIDSSQTLETEKDKEFVEWRKRKISPWAVAASELMNSTIYSPVAEEIFFRLVLMKYIFIRGAGMNYWVANVLQAVIFGLMHMSNSVYSTQTSGYTDIQTFSSMISGLVSGWVYIKCNSLIPLVLAHMINNGVAGAGELAGYVKYLKNHPI